MRQGGERGDEVVEEEVDGQEGRGGVGKWTSITMEGRRVTGEVAVRGEEGGGGRSQVKRAQGQYVGWGGKGLGSSESGAAVGMRGEKNR